MVENKICLNSQKIKSTIDFTPDMVGAGQRIIVYGASVYGEITLNLLKKAGLKPDFYCDKIVKGFYLNIPVLKPEELEFYRKDWILIASADYFHEITAIAKGKGCNFLGNISRLLLDYPLATDNLSKRAIGYYVNRKNYIDVSNQMETKETLNLTRIQFVVSERCSLKCKDCLHLMQYYQHPKDIDLDGCRDSFERLLNVVESVSEIRILGGEPFMNREMYKVIEWWHEKENINIFRVYTNGTIIPSEKNLELLKHQKVDVYISDYEINRDKIEKLTAKFDEMGIKYYVSPYDGWADAGKPIFKNYSKEKKKEIFEKCHARNCISFVDGRLFRCPRAAHLERLGIMQNPDEDYVDIKSFDGTDDDLKRRVGRLLEKNWIEACNYCDGADLHVPQIPAGIQIREPLSYSKIQEG